MGQNAISIPHKKTKNKDLRSEQKTENRDRVQKKIVVEQIMRVVKFFRVVAEIFRVKSENYEQVILTVCRLVRWQTGAIVLLT